MSSPEPKPGRNVFARAFALLAACLALSGCFQPLYGTFSADGNIAAELQAIEIDPIPARLGHYLVNDLIFAFNGTGSHVTPKYRLIVSVRENVQTPLVDTVTGLASAATVVVNAEYRLIPVQGGEPIAKGVATVAASYDRTSQRFANIRAARDGEIRNARTLSDQIHTAIAAALATRG